MYRCVDKLSILFIYSIFFLLFKYYRYCFLFLLSIFFFFYRTYIPYPPHHPKKKAMNNNVKNTSKSVFNYDIVKHTKYIPSRYEIIAIINAKIDEMVQQEKRHSSVNDLKNLQEMIDHVNFQLQYNIVDNLTITREFPNMTQDKEIIPVSRLVYKPGL